MKKITITEAQFKKLTNAILKEWNDSPEAKAYHDEENRYDAQMERNWDNYDSDDDLARDSFVQGGYMKELEAKFPEMDLDFEVYPDGSLKIFDLNDEEGHYYLGQGELDYETQCMNYPSATDRFSQAEEECPYYDFTKCMAEIAQKIANGLPDGTDMLQEMIEKAITKALNESKGLL